MTDSVTDVEVSSMGMEEGDGVARTVHCRHVERGVAMLVAKAHTGALLERRLDALNVVLLTCLYLRQGVERGGSEV